jgi:transposase InsO family protein
MWSCCPAWDGKTPPAFSTDWYARLGAKVERVMTDNGSAYRSKMFAKALQQAQARHIRTRPYTPRTNGKAERFIQTSLSELLPVLRTPS